MMGGGADNGSQGFVLSVCCDTGGKSYFGILVSGFLFGIVLKFLCVVADGLQWE